MKHIACTNGLQWSDVHFMQLYLFMYHFNTTNFTELYGCVFIGNYCYAILYSLFDI